MIYYKKSKLLQYSIANFKVSSPVLFIIDILLFTTHLAVISINLFGWIFRKTRKIQAITILATIFSWFVMGFWFGWGYCFLTDWEWKIKSSLGEKDLPVSFIHYLVNNVFGFDLSPPLLDIITVIAFSLAILLCIITNYRDLKEKVKA